MKEKALNDFHNVAKTITVKHKRFKTGIFLLLLVGTEHPILLILLFHCLELSLSGWIRK